MRRGNAGALRANGFLNDHLSSPNLAHGKRLLANFNSETWNIFQVIEWLKGIDDGVAHYVRVFKKARVDGRRLHNFDDSYLHRIGVTREATRSKILQATSLLSYYNYTIRYENLQKLAVDASTYANNLLNAVDYASPIINNPSQSSRVLDVLNSVLRAFQELHEHVLKLIFWLDRSPFDENKLFVQIREKISALIEEMVDCINNPNNPKFLSVPSVLVERGRTIREICQEIVVLDDPLILYTSYLERVRIRRAPGSNWGIEVGCTCTGVNLVTQVDLESPAGVSGKVDVGDEIVQVNGATVAGWNQTNVMRKMNELNELDLLLSKRPRESWSDTSLTQLTKPRSALLSEGSGEIRSKMMIDFKLKIQPEIFARNQSLNDANKKRGRSSSFSLLRSSWKKSCERCALPAGRCVSLFVGGDKRIMQHQPLFRRASVWNESPPAMLRSPFDGLHDQSESNAWLLLLASWGPNRQKSSTPKEIITPNPIISNGRIIEEDEYDESSSDEAKKTLDTKRVVFSSIEIVPDLDLDRLRIAYPSINDNEWNAPIVDITGLQVVKRSHLESGSSQSIVDSPLSTFQAKITKFFYGDSTNLSATSTVQEPRSTAVNSDKLSATSDRFECKTPITKSHEFLFISTKTNSGIDDSGGESSSVESPSPCIAKVRTIKNRRSRLAPLAEPDEIGDLSSAPSCSINAEKPLGESFDQESVVVVKCSLNELASIPCQDHQHKTLEGWARRQRLLSDNDGGGRSRSQWVKCWMVLKDDILYIYPNQFAHEANIVINVSYYYVTPSTARTSKKHVFALCWNSETLNFALYSHEDLKFWIECLKPIARRGTSSAAFSEDVFTGVNGSIENIQNVNRFSALFVRSTSTDDCASTDSHSPSPLTPAAVSPRTTNFFYPTAARIFNKVSRQSSRCGSATPAPGNDDTLLPGSSEPPR
ncbi:connector enhancer of kinase suppressor of ras domain-containing protein [Ditylenchus destructor]|uniref:Connector enhancer of kinase suppressor of ras domain-containing protein n=1 Tax=Ditylenchus destructor TaxID=166010 RepID=A0AAD4RBA3_9BILA|nr:connector enhancer of kinase suppressor of ras domain-containing protein [Ditylenchus destructor]